MRQDGGGQCFHASSWANPCALKKTLSRNGSKPSGNVGELHDPTFARLRHKKDRKTYVTPALSTRSAQAVCSCTEGQSSTATATRYLLGTMVSIYQDGERTREEESSGEDHYERSRDELPDCNGI